ncbi:MAG: hypothetical protein WC911_01945 [Thermoleophilia bacterium]
MTVPVLPNSANFTELRIREILLRGIVDLASDEERLNLLFRRVDGLPQGTQETWAEDLKTLLKLSVTDPAARIRVIIGYPWDVNSLPCWSIVKEGGSENDSEATMGDEAGLVNVQTGHIHDSDGVEWPRIVGYTAYGIPWTSNFQIGTWATTPDVSILLHEAAIEILDIARGELDTSGVQSISLSEPGGMIPNPEQHPSLGVGYIPLVRVSCKWTRLRLQKRSPRPTHVTRRTTTLL